MNIATLTKKIDFFKQKKSTDQSWQMNKYISFDNDCLTLLRVDTSNKAGGQNVLKGKQWSIIIEIKKDITQNANWKALKTYYGDNLMLNKVLRGTFIGKDAIRFYCMEIDPTEEIIKDILVFISV